jgi:hypothetical protein
MNLAIPKRVAVIVFVPGGFIRERVSVAGAIPADMQNAVQVIPTLLMRKLDLEV